MRRERDEWRDNRRREIRLTVYTPARIPTRHMSRENRRDGWYVLEMIK